MSHVVRLPQSCSILLLVIATSAFANDSSLKYYDEQLNQLIQNYRQTCGTTGLLTNLATLFKPNSSDLVKECEPRKIEALAYSVLSDANDKTSSDSTFREWYEKSSARIRSTISRNRPQSPLLQQTSIERRLINDSLQKNNKKKSDQRISTARGYQTVDGK